MPGVTTYMTATSNAETTTARRRSCLGHTGKRMRKAKAMQISAALETDNMAATAIRPTGIHHRSRRFVTSLRASVMAIGRDADRTTPYSRGCIDMPAARTKPPRESMFASSELTLRPGILIHSISDEPVANWSKPRAAVKPPTRAIRRSTVLTPSRVVRPSAAISRIPAQPANLNKPASAGLASLSGSPLTIAYA